MIKQEQKIYFHNYYLKHKKELSDLNKLWKQNHEDYMSGYMKEYYKKNKIKMLNEAKEYRKTHKKEYDEYKKKYYLKNAEELCLKSRKWYQENKELRRLQYQQNKKILNINKNKYFIKRRKEDINFRILCNLRIRLWKVLKGINKSNSTIKLLGCSIKFLKKYLELKFKLGMTWENYGKWEVDHIKPCASFDLSKPREQRKCFHYTNLQPLWEEENILKRDKLISN